jgi:hypothetical protein
LLRHVWYKFTDFSDVLAASIIRASIIIALMMMEAARTSEASVNFYQNARRNNLEDSHLHTRRRENLKSHYIYFTTLPITKIM